MRAFPRWWQQLGGHPLVIRQLAVLIALLFASCANADDGALVVTTRVTLKDVRGIVEAPNMRVVIPLEENDYRTVCGAGLVNLPDRCSLLQATTASGGQFDVDIESVDMCLQRAPQ
jgi:hypothetical protein